MTLLTRRRNEVLPISIPLLPLSMLLPNDLTLKCRRLTREEVIALS